MPNTPTSGMVIDPAMPPDIALQAAQLQRRQALAQGLMEQGMGQSPNEVVTGRVVQQSPVLGLAKLLQAYMGQKMQNETDQKMSQLGPQLMAARLQMAKAMTQDPSDGAAPTDQPPAPPVAQGAPGAMPSPMPAGGPVPVPQGGAMPAPTATPPSTPTSAPPTQGSPQVQALKNQAMMAYAMNDMAQFNKLMENLRSLTPEMKNMLFMSQDPKRMGALDIAAKIKAATQSFKPGDTNVIPGQAKPFVAPDFQNNINPSYDDNGNPSVAPIPGASGAAAQLAAAKKQAELGVGDRFATPLPPITPQGANGPVAMLPSQARAAANGGVDPAFPKVNPGAQQARDAERRAILQKELNDPANINGPKANYDALKQEAQFAGIKLQTPAEAKAAEAAGPAVENWAKVKAAAAPLLETIKEAKSIVNDVSSGSYGLAETKEKLANLPGIGNNKTSAANARFEQLMGQLTMSGIASSGLGRMDIPIVNAIKEASDIPLSLSPAGKLAKLNQLEKSIKDHVTSLENVTPYLNTPGATSNTHQTPMSGPASSGGFKIIGVR